MTVAHEYNNSNLNITIELTIKPFDVREYKNAFSSLDSSGSDNLKWLYCTIYNYIPISIIHNTQQGIYANIDDGNWEEVYPKTLWENSTFEIQGSEWQYGSLVLNSQMGARANMFIDDLKELAERYITRNDAWYKTILGRTFSFTNALNANMEFSHLNPNTYKHFTPLVIETLNNAATYDKYSVWKLNSLETNPKLIKVKIKTTIPNVTDDEDKTYAVVSADPSTGKILTEYIYIRKQVHEVIDKFQYIDDSLTIIGADNEIIASITQVSDKRIRLKLTKNQSQWKNLTPQIRFKVKHITS